MLKWEKSDFLAIELTWKSMGLGWVSWLGKLVRLSWLADYRIGGIGATKWKLSL